MNMNRRQALKSIALSTGVVISSTSFVGILQAAEKSTAADWTPVFLNKEEMIAVSRIADVILPASQTPGALDVGVPQFIDLLLKDIFTVEQSDKFRKGLHLFMQRFEKENGKPFHKSKEKLQRKFVEQLYSVSPERTKSIYSLVAGDAASAVNEDDYYFWSFLVTQRELTIKSYFTSEQVGEKVLSYDPIPGRYDPCIPVEDVGNVWSFG